MAADSECMFVCIVVIFVLFFMATAWRKKNNDDDDDDDDINLSIKISKRQHKWITRITETTQRM